MKTALVTGGAGFIGSHLCKRLSEDSYKVICVDNLITGSRQNIQALQENNSFEFINHDVTESLAVDKDVDYVFHLASPASPNHHSPISYHALPMQTMLVNTQGTLNMLKVAKRNNARFLFASTSEVYGDPKEHPQKESYNGNVSSTGPRSVYDEAKRFGETLTMHFVRKENLDARIVRIFNTYGPNMAAEDKRMIVNFITQALKGDPITIYGDGTQTRSLCFVDDLVEGLMRMMKKDDLKGEIINLGSTDEHSVKEYADYVKKITQSQSEITTSEDLPKNDPLQRRPDLTKAKSLLDWQPTTTLEEGLQKTINYHKRLL